MVDIEYTNKFLLDLIQKHIDDYQEDVDNIVEVVIGGETINDNRITTITIVAPNSHKIFESTEVKTGDTFKII